MVCIVCFLISSCNRSVSEGNAVKYDIDTILNKSEPITINIWHYYSATQKENFDSLIDNFNASEGAKYGVYVRGIRRAGNASEIASFLAKNLEQMKLPIFFRPIRIRLMISTNKVFCWIYPIFLPKKRKTNM